MTLQTSSDSTNACSPSESLVAAPPAPDDTLLPGRQWQSRFVRADGSRKLVVVVSLVGPLRVEVEDVATGDRNVIMTRSLSNTYTAIARGAPSANRAPSRNENGSAKQLDAELVRLSRAVADARVPDAKITTVQWEVKPALAEALLANNPRNRAPSLAVVTLYARDLTDGHWPLSHQGLAVGPGLELGDGAHRHRRQARGSVA